LIVSKNVAWQVTRGLNNRTKGISLHRYIILNTYAHNRIVRLITMTKQATSLKTTVAFQCVWWRRRRREGASITAMP